MAPHQRWTRLGFTLAVIAATLGTGVPRSTQAQDGLTPELADRVASATLLIASELVSDDGSDDVAYPHGSGTLISSDGLVLTNAHVLEKRDSAQAWADDQNSSGSGPTLSLVEDFLLFAVNGENDLPRPAYRATIEQMSDASDLALLRITEDEEGHEIALPLDREPLKLGDLDEILSQAEVHIFGFPIFGDDLVDNESFKFETIDHVSGRVRRNQAGVLADTVGTILVDARVAGGSSGGAAVDERGRLIGIPTLCPQEQCSPVELTPVNRAKPLLGVGTNHFSSPDFEWAVTWDGDTWDALTNRDWQALWEQAPNLPEERPGELVLASATEESFTLVSITGVESRGPDISACFDQQPDMDLSNGEEFRPVVDEHGDPVARSDRDQAIRAFTDGDVVYYAECRVNPASGDWLLIFLVGDGLRSYEDWAPMLDALIATLTFGADADTSSPIFVSPTYGWAIRWDPAVWLQYEVQAGVITDEEALGDVLALSGDGAAAFFISAESDEWQVGPECLDQIIPSTDGLGLEAARPYSGRFAIEGAEDGRAYATYTARIEGNALGNQATYYLECRALPHAAGILVIIVVAVTEPSADFVGLVEDLVDGVGLPR